MTDKPVSLAMPRPMQPRAVQPRLWRNLALGAAVSLAAAPALAHDHKTKLETAKEMGATLWTVQAEGGEGGEAGGIATGDDTVDFLANLLQIEGHLTSGFALWAAGDHDNGQAHMGHPYAEVYPAIEAKLVELKAAPFEDELEALVDAAANGKPQADLDTLRAAIQSKIDAARKAADDGEVKDGFTAIVMLLRKAGTEFGGGVKAGKVEDLHEYQDAWGFVQAAKVQADLLAQSADPVVKAAAETTQRTLAELDPTLTSVSPTEPLPGEESWFAAAAAKIELAAYKVK